MLYGAIDLDNIGLGYMACHQFGQVSGHLWCNADQFGSYLHDQHLKCYLGAESIWRCHVTSIGNPIVEMRRSYDGLISTMGFPILVRWHLYIESGPRCSEKPHFGFHPWRMSMSIAEVIITIIRWLVPVYGQVHVRLWLRMASLEKPHRQWRQ